MNVYTFVDLLRLRIEAAHKPCLELAYISSTDPIDETGEIMKAAPYLSSDQALQLAMEGFLCVEFDDYDEMLRHHYMTVGDDGPTETNDYQGPARVYSCTWTGDGVSEFENT